MKRASRVTLVTAIATTLGGGMGTSLRAMEILMMKMRKSRAGLAVAAVLGAAFLAPSASFGYAVDVLNNAMVTSSGGDSLLFPIYTTATGSVNGVPTSATTSFSITNTDPDKTVLIKIRFREQDHSMDALDFVVALSPNDKFDYTVAAGNPRPVMSWSDNSCVIGPTNSQIAAKSVPFQPPFTPFVTTNEQMGVGHMEVFALADISNTCVTASGMFNGAGGCAGGTTLGSAATHGPNGVPANCALLRTVFGSPTNVQSINVGGGANGFQDTPNSLVGRYAITIPNQGIEGASDAIAIQNSNITTPGGAAGQPTQVSAQSNAVCSALAVPTNCTSFYAWDKQEFAHPNLADLAKLANFQNLLTTSSIAGDWSNNPVNHVGVDWVTSLAEKYAYLDYNVAGGCGGVATNNGWCLLNATPTGFGTVGVYVGADTPNLCINDNQFQAYDKEEQGSGAVVSPGSGFNICPELYVFTLSNGIDTPIPSVIQTAARRDTVVFSNLDTAVRGWATLPINWALLGDGVTGILWTTRATGDPTQNNGSITELQKIQ